MTDGYETRNNVEKSIVNFHSMLGRPNGSSTAVAVPLLT